MLSWLVQMVFRLPRLFSNLWTDASPETFGASWSGTDLSPMARCMELELIQARMWQAKTLLLQPWLTLNLFPADGKPCRINKAIKLLLSSPKIYECPIGNKNFASLTFFYWKKPSFYWYVIALSWTIHKIGNNLEQIGLIRSEIADELIFYYFTPILYLTQILPRTLSFFL